MHLWLFFSASHPATPLCPRFWMNWASICLTNFQVSSFHQLPLCHIGSCFPCLASTGVGCRSSEHRRKPVGSSREEGRAPGCHGWRRRWSGGAIEQPPERLRAATCCPKALRQKLLIKASWSLCGWGPFTGLPGTKHSLSQQCSQATWLSVCCLFIYWASYV